MTTIETQPVMPSQTTFFALHLEHTRSGIEVSTELLVAFNHRVARAIQTLCAAHPQTTANRAGRL